MRHLTCRNLVFLVVSAAAIFGLSTEWRSLRDVGISFPQTAKIGEPCNCIDSNIRNDTIEIQYKYIEVPSAPLENSTVAPKTEDGSDGKRVFSRQIMCSHKIRGEKVLFDRVSTMAVFNNAQSSHSGEEYVFACLDWAFRQIGVEVHRRDRSIEELSPAFLAQYHRIFSNGVNWHPDFHEHPEVTCKVRTLHFWGNKIPGPEAPYDQRQILSPFPEDYNTFLGFFPHELVAQNRTIPDRHRGKEGLIVGKVAFLFQLDPDFVPAVQTLIDSGFTMHSVCREQLENNCGLPDGVVMHSSLSPEEYSQLIARMAFLIGAGAPIISPSPFVGWAQGAAWLNPFVTTNDPRHRNQTRESLQKYPLHWMHPPNTNVIVTQHTPISMLGAPYVYNVDLSDKASVVQAAYRAVRYRFASYAHPLFRPGAMIDRVCTLMEDDAVCDCPGLKEKYQQDDPDWHCNGSSYIQNKVP